MSLKTWEINACKSQSRNRKELLLWCLTAEVTVCIQYVSRSISENQNSQAHPSTTINILVMLFGLEQHAALFF